MKWVVVTVAVANALISAAFLLHLVWFHRKQGPLE